MSFETAVFYFLSSDLKEGRSITIGRKGLRVNDITFDDPAMDNTQAVIVYKKGKFYIDMTSADKANSKRI